MGPLSLTPSLFRSVLVNEFTGGAISSICFSPDGKLLATGTRTGTIQVSSRTFTLAIVIAVVIFEANAQHRITFGVLDLGYCQEANP